MQKLLVFFFLLIVKSVLEYYCKPLVKIMVLTDTFSILEPSILKWKTQTQTMCNQVIIKSWFCLLICQKKQKPRKFHVDFGVGLFAMRFLEMKMQERGKSDYINLNALYSMHLGVWKRLKPDLFGWQTSKLARLNTFLSIKSIYSLNSKLCYHQ